MKATIENLGPWERKIAVEIPADEVSETVERTYRELAKGVRVRGFRKGKVPRTVMTRMYGDQVRNEVIQALINRTYGETLRTHQLEPVSEPVIEPEKLAEGQPWRYTARLEVRPEVKVQKWEKLALAQTEAVVDDAAVKERLERLAGMHAQLVVEEGATRLARGHFAVIDYEGSVEGTPFEGGAGKEVTIEIGSGRFIPGFEDQLEGMAAGEAREVTVTFPEDYGKSELAGKPALFQVTLKEIKKKVVPAIDDEFAKDTGEFENLEALRAKVSEDIQRELDEESRRTLREQAKGQLVAENPVEAPPAMVEREFRSAVESTRQRLSTQGVDPERLGLTPEALEREWRPRAELDVKASLILDQIARDRGFEVTAEDIDAFLEPMAREAKQRVSTLRAAYEERGLLPVLERRIKDEKALDLVLEKATIQKEKSASDREK
ncbi:MAG: trigger factor [Deltaproteobacteria bacterium]|nr:trigger factor [Deltaproteobacteria bacterium]